MRILIPKPSSEKTARIRVYSIRNINLKYEKRIILRGEIKTSIYVPQFFILVDPGQGAWNKSWIRFIDVYLVPGLDILSHAGYK